MAIGKKDTTLIEEIKANFDYSVAEFDDIRKEARTDMRFVSGDPWDPDEKKSRKNRPTLSLDELSQYINQQINNLRMNKRSIKVNPVGDGANDETAEIRENLIRGIEYDSKAQSAYITAFENCLHRSYGWFRIGKDYRSYKSFDQEIKIRRIANPDAIYPDPNAKEADFSDMRWCFAVEDVTKVSFKRDWPNAEPIDFEGSNYMESHPHWVKEKTIQVAEYWKVKSTYKTLYQLDTGEAIFLDETPGAELIKNAEGGESVIIAGVSMAVVNKREAEIKKITQYWTNGIEILEETPWDGGYIPFIPVIGKELYVDSGTGAKRIWMSLTRLARDPIMLYNYYRSSQAEVVAMTPKIPYMGYEGSFDTKTPWANINKLPIAYAEAKATTEQWRQAGGEGPMPLPKREAWEPPIQALEIGAESAKRAIQSALGMFQASVGNTDISKQSGKAIEALDLQSDQGNFHFIDNFDKALEHAGRIIDELIPKTYDTPRDVSILTPDETYKSVKINEPYQEKAGPETKVVEHKMDQGEHGVTISVGPSMQSQREESTRLGEKLLENELFAPRVADLVIKNAQLGAHGDEMAKRLKPPDVDDEGNEPIPPGLQQEMQKAQQLIDALTEQLNAAKDELEAKEKEYANKLEVTQLQEETKRINKAAELEMKQLEINGRANIDELKASIQAIQIQLQASQAERAQEDAEKQSEQNQSKVNQQ